MMSKGYRIGFTRRIFWTFVCVSVLLLIYINMTPNTTLRQIADLFPELDISIRKGFVHGYRVVMSFAIFFIDILLVGPFAYLSYFSDHIIPKREKMINHLSFFDIGLLLAFVFTLSVTAFHFMITNAVSQTPIQFISEKFVWISIGVAFVAWIVLVVMKVYSYKIEQRKELTKYMIRF